MACADNTGRCPCLECAHVISYSPRARASLPHSLIYPALSVNTQDDTRTAQAMLSGKTIYVSGGIGITRARHVARRGRRARSPATVTGGSGAHSHHCNWRPPVSASKHPVYLTNLQRDFTPMNDVYLQYFSSNPPARTCIGVAALPLGADVEIECIV
ncbi:hypothetical protein BD413DRAFT_483753 [Trametes elegans]|nr:hypothetical protein BD413DRAFT_483753 [Trametes elegans]